MTDAPAIALESFKVALDRHVDELTELDHVDLVARCVELCESHTVDESATIGDALLAVVRCGSIEAAAALVVIGAAHAAIATALRELAQRYPDVKEGLQIEALTHMLEEFADGEVAAGRMTVARGPNGEKLYGSPEGGKP